MLWAAAAAVAAATLVQDESVRLTLLRTAFPNSVIAQVPSGDLLWQQSFWREVGISDALSGQPEYHVRGPVQDDERSWAEDATAQARTDLRRLRMVAFAVPALGRDAYVLVTHYTFPEVQHADCCQYMVRAYVVWKNGHRWQEAHSPDSLARRGVSVGSVNFADLTGDGVPELAVEAESTRIGHDAWEASMTTFVFSLLGHKPRELARATTAVRGFNCLSSRSVIDIEGTRRARGSKLVLRETHPLERRAPADECP